MIAPPRRSRPPAKTANWSCIKLITSIQRSTPTLRWPKSKQLENRVGSIIQNHTLGQRHLCPIGFHGMPGSRSTPAPSFGGRCHVAHGRSLDVLIGWPFLRTTRTWASYGSPHTHDKCKKTCLTIICSNFMSKLLDHKNCLLFLIEDRLVSQGNLSSLKLACVISLSTIYLVKVTIFKFISKLSN